MHVIEVGQTKMFRRRHIAEKVRSGGSSQRAADCRRDVVIAGSDVRGERPQDIKGRAFAEALLQGDVGLDLGIGNVARTFDHDLDIPRARPPAQFTENNEFLNLAPVRRVGKTPGPQAVTEAEDHVVAPGDFQESVILRVEGIFRIIVIHPSGRNGAAPADDPQEASLGGDAAHALAGHSAVDGDEIHAVLAVFLDGLEHFIRRHFHDGFPAVQGLGGGGINGDGAYRHGGSVHNGLPDRPYFASRG
ncbi:MAG: hypothetical protein A4E68_01679 [Syntrophaceae bacterium PtaB.Bin095]|nr:MAG: hypothetical protein A4E68_01679 [Syntrophaceae bacterium PtaB.Bin095]